MIESGYKKISIRKELLSVRLVYISFIIHRITSRHRINCTFSRKNEFCKQRLSYIFAFIIYFFLYFSSEVNCQNDISRDSVWKLDDLNPTDSVFDKKPSYYASLGWFPSPIPDIYFWNGSINMGDVYDITNGLRSKAFTPTKFPFTGNTNLSKDDRKIKKALSKSFESNYPVTKFYEFEFSHNQSASKFIFKTAASIGVLTSILFSEDNTKAYLGYDGLKKSFKEVSIIETHELYGKLSLGPELPIYGGFLEFDSSYHSSYYTISANLFGIYTFSSSTNQFFQISNAKDELRYSTNTDTLRTQTEVKLYGLNRLRYGVDINLSWVFNIMGNGINLGFGASIPFNSVLEDGLWKQYKFCLRLGIISGMDKKKHLFW
ncbi:MAG: hypothetical protein NT007_13890 [Candidatus Kapabacteria bacterium]|nr:hypothetical protein [Candidatus Kapabacteria bacterium]